MGEPCRAVSTCTLQELPHNSTVKIPAARVLVLEENI